MADLVAIMALPRRYGAAVCGYLLRAADQGYSTAVLDVTAGEAGASAIAEGGRPGRRQVSASSAPGHARTPRCRTPRSSTPPKRAPSLRAAPADGDAASASTRDIRTPARRAYGSSFRRPYGEPYWTGETVEANDVVEFPEIHFSRAMGLTNGTRQS